MTEKPTIRVVEDRYGGGYSGGKFLAVAVLDSEEDAQAAIDAGPNGGDCDAMLFWANPPEFIAVGDTAEEAVAALEAKF